jgi:hypothetical protein
MVMADRQDSLIIGGKDREAALHKAEKLTEWAKEPSVAELKQDLEAARGYNTTFTTKIQEWRDLRDVSGKEKPKKTKGRSSIQPKVVRRQAEWRYSALTEPFHGSDKLFTVSPRTFEDTASAQQNEQMLNYQFDNKIRKTPFIDEYVHTCVDEGAVIVRVGWERTATVVEEEVPVWGYMPIPEIDQAGFEELSAWLELKESNPNEYMNLPPEAQESVEYYLETDIPVRAAIVGMEKEKVEKITENRPILRFVNPRNFYPDPSCEGDLDRAKSIVTSFETSYAELKAAGVYKNLKSINWEGSSPLNQPDHDTQTPTDFNYEDKERKRVVAYEYWGYRDIKGDGTLTCILATWIGDVLIRCEESPFPDGKPPFVLVPYLPVSRELMGETDAELLADNQRVVGAVTRGIIDLMGRSANSQQGIVKGFLDPVNRARFERGEDYEFNPTAAPDAAIHMHKYPEIPQSAIVVQQMQNADAEALTGVKSFTGGMSGNAYGNVAAGIRGMLDASAKREMNILRRLAFGLCEIGKKIIAMNALFLKEEEVIRITNKKFIRIRREDLKGNFDLKIDIATNEIDEMKAQKLAFMLQTIGPGLDWSITRMILSEITRLERMPDLSEQILRFEPQPDPLEVKRQELEITKLELELQELQSRVELNKAKAKEASSKADLNDLDFVEQETGTKHERNMDKQSAQAEANQQLVVTKGIMDAAKKPEKSTEAATTEAIGFNALSKRMNNDDPSGNLGSKYFDPALDPSLNPRLNL